MLLLVYCPCPLGNHSINMDILSRVLQRTKTCFLVFNIWSKPVYFRISSEDIPIFQKPNHGLAVDSSLQAPGMISNRSAPKFRFGR